MINRQLFAFRRKVIKPKPVVFLIDKIVASMRGEIFIAEHDVFVLKEEQKQKYKVSVRTHTY